MCQIDELNNVSESVNNLQETIKKLSSNLSGMKDDSKDKIYLQLHEQYAINNNANLSTIMTLVIALIGVIGYYGYIFINTTNKFKGNLFDLYISSQCQYHLEALILVYLASISILAILFCLCTYQGIAQRKEQFIIHEIRKKYKINEDTILPSHYQPYNKKCLKVIQGLYGELVKIYICVFVVLTALTVFQIHSRDIPPDNSSIIVFSKIFTIGIVLLCGWYFWKNKKSYKDEQIEYEQKRKPSKTKSQNSLCSIGANVTAIIIAITITIVMLF